MASGTSQEGSCQQGDCGRVTVTSPQLSPPHGNRPRLHPGGKSGLWADSGSSRTHTPPPEAQHYDTLDLGGAGCEPHPCSADSSPPCDTRYPGDSCSQRAALQHTGACLRVCVRARACVSARTCLPQACGVVGGGEPGSPDTPTCTSNLHLPSCTAAGSPPHPHDGVCNATPGATWLPAGHPPGTSASACAGQPGAP